MTLSFFNSSISSSVVLFARLQSPRTEVDQQHLNSVRGGENMQNYENLTQSAVMVNNLTGCETDDRTDTQRLLRERQNSYNKLKEKRLKRDSLSSRAGLGSASTRGER
jgi:hypothetical protein